MSRRHDRELGYTFGYFNHTYEVAIQRGLVMFRHVAHDGQWSRWFPAAASIADKRCDPHFALKLKQASIELGAPIKAHGVLA